MLEQKLFSVVRLQSTIIFKSGSFGRLETAGVIIDNNNVSATSFTGIFQGALSGSAQIASNISGAFVTSVASASFASNITNLQVSIVVHFQLV